MHHIKESKKIHVRKVDVLLRREKVISYFIKYVDEMDALSLREILPNGVFSTCFGHVEQQSYTVVLKVKKESTKNSHVQKTIVYFMYIHIFRSSKHISLL